MLIAITGSNGFIGKNLYLNLSQNKNFKVFKISRQTKINELKKICKKCDILYHLAGANRPKNDSKFNIDNFIYTKKILEALSKNKKKPPIIYTSTSRYNEKTKYAISKKKAEKIIIQYSKKNLSNYYILRLPNVFGKWAKPFYNSFLTTIFYQVTRNKTVKISRKNKEINLIYIDDLIENLKKFINIKKKKSLTKNLKGKKYKLGFLYNKIINIWKNKKENIVLNTATSLDRKLYATLLTYMPKKDIFEKINSNDDHRGSFIEMLKTEKSGQFAFFSINPGKQRGGHFHNTKNEKFVLINGIVELELKNMENNQKIKKKLNSEDLMVFTSVPGWKHTFINKEKYKANILVWANETLNLKKIDTYNVK